MRDLGDGFTLPDILRSIGYRPVSGPFPQSFYDRRYWYCAECNYPFNLFEAGKVDEALRFHEAATGHVALRKGER